MLLHLCVFHIIVCQLKTQCGFERASSPRKRERFKYYYQKVIFDGLKKSLKSNLSFWP